MLVLSRHLFERIIIHVPGLDSPIVIEPTKIVAGSQKPHVRIGITAPKEVIISREELLGGDGRS